MEQIVTYCTEHTAILVYTFVYLYMHWLCLLLVIKYIKYSKFLHFVNVICDVVVCLDLKFYMIFVYLNKINFQTDITYIWHWKTKQIKYDFSIFIDNNTGSKSVTVCYSAYLSAESLKLANICICLIPGLRCNQSCLGFLSCLFT